MNYIYKTEKLEKLELHYDKKTNNYYLSAEYLAEDNKGRYKITIPRIILPVNKHSLPDLHSIYGIRSVVEVEEVNLGFGYLPVTTVHDPKVGDYMYIKETLEEELTLEEIEKRLGYKVKIVSEKTKGGKK